MRVAGWALVGVGLVLLVGAEAALASRLQLAGVPPDLPLVAVLVIALRSGPAVGGVAGLLVGAVLDLLHGVRLGMFALGAGLAGWAVGEAAARADPGRAATRWCMLLLGSALYGGTVVGCWWAFHRPDVAWHGAVRHLVIGALYDATLSALCFWPFAAAARRPVFRRR